MMKFAWLFIWVMLAFPAFAQAPANATATPKVEALPKINPDDFCKGRKGCKYLWSGDAGSLDKKRFIISEIVLPHPAKDGEKKCRRPQDKRYGEFLDNVSQEIWFSTYGGLLPEHKKLFELCNDGYGAANIGEDSFSFGKQHVTYRQAGGDNNRWVWARSYALPSLSYTGTMLCDYRTNTSGGHIRLMNYETGAFTSGYSPQESDDSQSSFVDCNSEDLGAAKPKYKSIDTKQISSFLGLKLGDVKMIGTCGSQLTSQPGPYQGYTIYGQDDGADVTVRYLRINDDRLWVELRDVEADKTPRIFKSTDNWANDDRIEIWWLDQRQIPGKGAVDLEDAPRKALRQFSVRLSDLKVFAGYGYSGNQKVPEVERRQGSLPLAFQIIWPPDQFPSPAGLTLSYAHADGNATKVMWASSTFKYADPQSLSPIFNLQGDGRDPREACVITKDGVLDLITPKGL
ncbi:MAG: hypothetical protein SFW65_04125 [Alphaproteobacteria bacterium]|nr:hypothetical protein [Alphaproteobacteria bacterium]